MTDTTPSDKNNKYQLIEKRINHILTLDGSVNTNYSDLRNLYSVISNDIRATTAKKLDRVFTSAKTVTRENLKTRHPKKESALYEAEGELSRSLENAPDINPQNISEGYQFLRELLPLLVKAKAALAIRLSEEKKEKKVRQLESQLDNIHGLSTQLHQLYNALAQYSFFDQFLFAFIKVKYNKDDINECVTQIQTVIKEMFKYPKEGDFDVINYGIIDHLTRWIHLKNALYESCVYYKTFVEILKRLPRLLVQQFNTRYFARRRNTAANNAELKASREYKLMTKKFITLKLQKFYELQRAYYDHISRLFAINDELLKQVIEFGEIAADKTLIANRKSDIKNLGLQIESKLNAFRKIVSDLPRDEDIRKNSIKTLNSFILNYYYNVLQDAYHPQSMLELASAYMKKGPISKELFLKPAELKYLANPIFERNENILRVFYQGIVELAKGETNDRIIIKPLMQALNKDYNRNQKDEMWTKAINALLNHISPDEISIFMDIIDSIPSDMERLNSPLGKFYQELAEKYYNHAKKKVNQVEKIKPTDTPQVKQQKIVIEKLDQIILKEAAPKIGELPISELLKQKKEEENLYKKASAEKSDLLATYYLSKLIANWKVETEKTVIDLCLGGGDIGKFMSMSPGVSRHEMRFINNYFRGEHLIEIEKHLKILAESVGGDYLNYPKPYNKVEYAILFATKNLMLDFENPAKSYPRTYERMTAINGKSKN